jgi:hypothetical protein
MSAPYTSSTPYARSNRKIPLPAAPNPTIPTADRFRLMYVLDAMFSNAASTTTAVPCWSSCITGMSRVASRRSSISKHSGARMSSSLMAPKVGAIARTVWMITSGSLLSIRIGYPLIPASTRNSSALPSITGMPATGPMSPSPKIAVPLVTIATLFWMDVYSIASSGFAWILVHTDATPGVYTMLRSSMVSTGTRPVTWIFP